jgi:hypothetical protein
MHRDLTQAILEQRQALEARPRLSAIPPKGGRKSDKWMNSLGLRDSVLEEALIRLDMRTGGAE